MLLSALIQHLGLKDLWQGWADRELKSAYTSDLLSDVMGNAKEGQALITIQAHKNTVAVASLVDSSCIIICNERPIPDDMLQAARQEGIPLLLSSMSQYEVSGSLWMLLKG